MKSNVTDSNNKKFKISAVCLCLLFVLTTIVGVLALPVKAFAAPAAEPDHALKFKQVAAGEDFAIALSYDNYLYGWSLTRENNEEGNKLTPTGSLTKDSTLGDYYPATPQRIDVKFYSIVESDSKTSYVIGYNNAVVEDTIVQIAATRTTAAFVTQKGYVYTWGKDTQEPVSSGMGDSRLLLRNITITDNSGSYFAGTVAKPHDFLPAPVNYAAAIAMHPARNGCDGTSVLSVPKLSAGDTNYALYYPNADNHNYIWGESVYELLNTGSYAFDKQITVQGYANASQMYAGAGTLFYKDSDDKFKVRGKNYTVQQGANVTSETTEGNTTWTAQKITTGVFATTTESSGTLNLWSGGTYVTSEHVENKTDNYYDFDNAVIPNSGAELSSAPESLKSDYTPTFKNSDYDNADVNALALPAVTAGEGYVYMLGNNGALSVLGDTTLGQNAVTGGNYVQAVAGKITVGKTILERLPTRDTHAKGNPDKWTKADNTYTLDNAYADGTTYISAALNDAGAVTVFGHIGAQALSSQNITQTLLNKHGVSNTNKIVAMASGYGNNLFLLSELGKIYRITTPSESDTTLQCIAYDTFQDAAGKTIANWTVNSANTISFIGSSSVSAGYFDTSAEQGQEVRATATVSLNGVVENKRVIGDDGTVSYVPREEEDKDSFVTATSDKVISSNRAADVYRLIVPVNKDAAFKNNENFVADAAEDESKLQNISQASATPEGVGLIEFYWNDSENTAMPAEVAFRYFKLQFTVDQDTHDVSFMVIPKMSTGGRNIVIRYWVGRYDTTAAFGLGANGNGFYDFKPVEVKVSIGNTYFTPHFTSATDNAPTLPLLDPNNPQNRYYSVAAMNVSQGMRDLAAALLSANVKSYQENALIDLMANEDIGFPSEKKVTEGHLDYYGQSAYYDNVYRYFVDDHDGDAIEFSRFGAGNVKNADSYIAYKTDYYNYTVDRVTLELALDISDADVIKKLCDLFGATTGNSKVPQFNNRYGLTVTLQGENKDENGYFASVTGCTVSYEVLRIEATKSMPEVVKYVQPDESVDISKPIFEMTVPQSETRPASATGLRSALISVTFTDGKSDTSTLQNLRSDVNRCVEVFTQSSLTLKNDPSVAGATNDGTPKVFDVDPIELKMGTNKSNTIQLSGYFNDNQNITVSYLPKGEDVKNYSPVGETAWNEFAASFGGSAAPLGITVHNISDTVAHSFTLNVRSAVDKYEFYVQLRRLQPDGRSLLPETEVIQLHFTVTVSFNKSQLLGAPSETPPSTYPVSQSADSKVCPVDITKRMTTTPAFLADYCTVNVVSSAPAVATAAVSADNQNIEITPLSNGTAWIRYTVRVNGAAGDYYTFTDSFEVRVSAMVSYPSTLYVSSITRITKSDMIGEIVKANSNVANFPTKLNLREENGKPFYFQTSDETGKSDAETNWSERLDSLPFLRNVEFDTSGSTLGMQIASFDAAQVANTSRIVVMFTGGNNNYELSIRVAPAAQTLKGKDSGELVLEINKGAKSINIVNEGDYGDSGKKVLSVGNDRYSVPLDFLRDLMPNNHKGNLYKILVVNTRSFDGTENYGKYLDAIVEGDNVILIPKYPTAKLDLDRCNVQVSVQDVTEDTVTVVNFAVRVNGIKTVLSASQYRTILLAVFFSVLVLLLIIFFIRLGIYWRKKADQRRIIKKNQMLIKMRDKMHNKTEAVKKEDLVRTKLKMEDPKYAKMFTEMRKEKEAETGISLENSVVADKAERKSKAAKASKKRKGGKKSIEELQAELLAKREAVARMQMGDFSGMPEMQPENAGVAESIPVQSVPLEDEPPQPVFDPDAGFEGLTAEQLDEQFRAAMGDEIVFDPIDENNNDNQG